MSMRFGNNETSSFSYHPHGPIVTRLWDILQPLSRFWGLVTGIVLSGAGAELVVLNNTMAPIVICGAVLVLALESMWAVALFVDLLARRGEYTPGLRCWDFSRWLCGRARAPLYACGGGAALVARLSTLVSFGGGALLVLASLRAALPWAPYATHGPRSPRARAGTTLLPQTDPTPDDVFFNTAEDTRGRSQEMVTLDMSQSPDRSPSASPAPPVLLDI